MTANATTAAPAEEVKEDVELKDCMVDTNGDSEDPNNLYTCTVDQSCCTVDLEPACCSKQSIEDELIQQAELWLPLIAIIIALALFIWWCRTDEACCDVEKPLLYRCGCKKDPEDGKDSSDDEDGESVKSAKSGQTLVVEEGGSDITSLVVEEGGHDVAELELAADNLEAQLDEEEAAQEEKDDENDDEGDEKEDENNSDKEGNDDENNDGDDQKNDNEDN